MKRYIVAALLALAAPAFATQTFLPSSYVNQNSCLIPPASPCEVELTQLAITDAVTLNNDARFVLFNLELNNVIGFQPQQAPPLTLQLRILVDGSTSYTKVISPAAGISTIQDPVTLTGLSIGPHTYQFFVSENAGPITYTTNTYSGVFALNVIALATGGGPTPTPLAFGTPGNIAIFAATPGTQLGSYGGTSCMTSIRSLSASGAATCAPTPTPTLTPTVTPTPTQTPTPSPTPTPGAGGSAKMFFTIDSGDNVINTTNFGSNFFGLSGSNLTPTTSFHSFSVIPTTGTFKNLVCGFGNNASVNLTGAQQVICALARPSNTTVTCTITASSGFTGACQNYGNGQCCTSSGTYSSIVGDTLGFNVVPSGGAPAGDIQMSVEFDPN